MNRELAKKLLPFIAAFAGGKTIQFLSNSELWTDVTEPRWVDGFEYRVKPEPKVRPYTYEEANLLVGTVVKLKSTGLRRIIVEGCDESIERLTVGEEHTSRDELLEEYTHLDGRPCGIEEGE